MLGYEGVDRKTKGEKSMEEKASRYAHKVQYYETDQMGIVHHSNYIRWFEEARTDWMDTIGFSYAKMEEEGLMVPVLSVDCQYKTMSKYGETVEIEIYVSSFTGVRMTFGYRVFDKDTQELRAEGESKHAFLNQDYRPVAVKRSHPHIYELLFPELKGK